MWYMWLKIGMDDKHHRYYKHTKFHQNPRGDHKFFVDLTRNDPYVNITKLRVPQCPSWIQSAQKANSRFDTTMKMDNRTTQ